MVAHDHKQGFLEVGFFARFFEELPQRPVGITHRRQMLVERTAIGYRLNRQWRRQGVWRVVGQGLQQRIERLFAFTLFQFFQATVEHVLVGHAPGRIREHRVDEIITTHKGGHALVTEET